MALESKKRLDDGTFGLLEKLGSGMTDKERASLLGEQLSQEKISSFQKQILINTLGSELTALKIQVLMMKGGN